MREERAGQPSSAGSRRDTNWSRTYIDLYVYSFFLLHSIEILMEMFEYGRSLQERMILDIHQHIKENNNKVQLNELDDSLR